MFTVVSSRRFVAVTPITRPDRGSSLTMLLALCCKRMSTPLDLALLSSALISPDPFVPLMVSRMSSDHLTVVWDLAVIIPSIA